MVKLSELNDNLWLFSDRTSELELVSSVRYYLDHHEENLGDYHTVSFADGGITLKNKVDLEN